MNITWQVLLSYDANQEFYQPINEVLDFSKIQNETKDFRLALIILLLNEGAKKIVSYTKSSMLFTITLPQGKNPVILFEELFNESFKGKADFHYVIQCAVNPSNYPTNVTNNKLSLHSNNFQLAVEKGEKLLPIIKTL